MLALMWTLIGIGLAAALVLGGVSLLQGTGPERLRVKETTTASFQGLAAAYQAYANANNAPPATGVSCASSALVPTYLPEVKLPINGMSCNLGTNPTYGDYFCLSTSMSQVQCNGMADAAAGFPSGAYVMNTTSCSTRTNQTCAGIGTFPATVYVTYWLQGQ